ETITDVVINLNYTARDGGKPLQDSFHSAMEAQPPQDALRMFSLRHEFPSEWYRFLHPPDTEPKQTMTLNLTAERFPFQLRGKTIQISKVELFLKWKDIWPETFNADGTLVRHNDTPLNAYADNRSRPLALYLTAPGDAAPGPADSPTSTFKSDNTFLNGL